MFDAMAFPFKSKTIPRKQAMKSNTKQTSPRVATQASKILSNPKSTPQEKSVAASDLAQTRSHPKPPRGK